MKYVRLLMGGLALCAAGNALADDAYLRLRCDGEAAGAEVSINGVKKGECPLDLAVPEGKVMVSVRKMLDEHRFKRFEKELFLAAGSMKRELVVLGPLQFTPEGQRLEDERVAREKAAAEAAAAAVLAEKQRLEAEKKKYGITVEYFDLMSSKSENVNSHPSLWTTMLSALPAGIILYPLSDLASGKKLFRSAGDPAVFANPDSMVARVQRQQAAVAD